MKNSYASADALALGLRSSLASRMDLTEPCVPTPTLMARSAAPRARAAAERPTRNDVDRRGSPAWMARSRTKPAKRRGRRADLAGVFPDVLDRPAGAAPVTGRHVLGNGRVLPVPACAQMNGDALALDGKSRRRRRSAAPRPRRGRTGQNTSGRRCRRDSRRRPGARATRCIRKGSLGKRLERRAVDLLEQLAAGDAELAGPAFVELRHEFAERG